MLGRLTLHGQSCPRQNIKEKQQVQRCKSKRNLNNSKQFWHWHVFRRKHTCRNVYISRPTSASHTPKRRHEEGSGKTGKNWLIHGATTVHPPPWISNVFCLISSDSMVTSAPDLIRCQSAPIFQGDPRNLCPRPFVSSTSQFVKFFEHSLHSLPLFISFHLFSSLFISFLLSSCSFTLEHPVTWGMTRPT